MRNFKKYPSEYPVPSGRPVSVFSPLTLLTAGSAVLKFIVHMLTAQGYGYFGDEFYAIAASRHLAAGYVDLPPLQPLLNAVSRLLFGESLLANHLFPALAGAATLVIVCRITRELGGGLFATALSALGFLAAPMWLIVDSFFCYDGINQLVLAVFLYILARYIRTENRRLWLGIGLTAGLAFMTKATILISAPGILAALLATGRRRDFLTSWPWAALGLFAVVISPWVIWEAANGWVTLEYWSVHAHSFYRYSLPEYFVNISLMMNPVIIPLLTLGLYRIFRRFGAARYGFFGIAFLVTAVIVRLLHARVFELAHLFIPLLAAGGVFTEELLSRLTRLKLRRVAEIACLSFLLASGIVEAPLCLPILPLGRLPAYSHAFGFLYKPVKDYDFEKSVYPQELSMRLGWDELVRKVADVYNGLPEDDRRQAVIYGSFFTTAGAIDVLGPRYGLPAAVSGHLTYHLWGPGDKPWDVVIAVVPDPHDRLLKSYLDVELKAYAGNTFSMAFNNYYIYVCRLRFNDMSRETIWERVKYFW